MHVTAPHDTLKAHYILPLIHPLSHPHIQGDQKQAPEKEDILVQKGGQRVKKEDNPKMLLTGGDGGHQYEIKTMTLVILVKLV